MANSRGGQTQAGTRRSRAKGRTSAEQFAAAQQQIQEKAKEGGGATELNLSGFTKLATLPPELTGLTALQRLDLTGTQVSDLAPLAGLTALQHLDLMGTQVSDLAPLARLTALQTLLLRGTQVSDLAPLAGLTALQRLGLMGTQVSDLKPLAGLTALQSLDLWRTQVSDLGPLAGLTALQSLDLTGTQVSDLAPLAGLTALQSLDLTGTQVSDLTPLAGLAALQSLDVRDTQVSDLSPIAGLTVLQHLDLTRSLVSNLSPLAGLAALEMLHLRGIRVSDLTPLAGLRSLVRLDLDAVPVSDLAPLAGLTALQSLGLDGTKISDLSPLMHMTELMEAACRIRNPGRAGLHYSRTPAARRPPFSRFVELPPAGCTVETINELRRRQGLAEYFPDGYEGPGDLSPPSPTEPQTDEEEADDRETLVQKPASHSFTFRRGRIEAQPQTFPPRHPDVAADIRDEVSKKAKEVSTRLEKCNAPRRIITTVSRLDTSLGSSLDEVRAGILQMRFRSLEADLAAYDTEDGRKEIPEDALAMLRDLASSVEDLMGCFPQLGDIEAERLAQRLKDTDVPKIMEALSEIRDAAEQSEAVAPSAVDALKAGEPELQHDTEIIATNASEPARIAALSARDRTVGYMLLVYRNFIAGAVKAGNELAGLGADTWRDFRKKAPEPLADAGISLVIAGLVNALLGPTAALGAFALSFKPLRDRAKRVADKLAFAAKRGKRSALPAKEAGGDIE